MTTDNANRVRPSPDPDGFANARFGRRQPAARSREPLGFWEVFAAVLLAMCVFSAVQGLVAWYVVSKELERTQREFATAIGALETVWTPPTVRTPATPRSRSSTGTQRLPGYPGPVTARANDASYACAGGRTLRRLPDGWEDVGGRCRATSQ